MFKVLLAVLALAIVTACGGDPEQEPEAQVSAPPVTEVTPPVSEATPTVTESPPAVTEAPPPAPETPTSIDSATVAQAFADAGLSAESLAPMTRDDYGAAPLVGEGTRFLIPSLGPDAGGRVIVGEPEDMSRIADYYVSLAAESALFFSHVFVSADGRVVVQINGDLPDAEASEYETVVASL